MTLGLLVNRGGKKIPSRGNPEIRHTAGDESEVREKHHTPCDVLEDMSLAIEKTFEIVGFSPLLSWSHYRTLTQVEHKNERLFYEIEAENICCKIKMDKVAK